LIPIAITQPPPGSQPEQHGLRRCGTCRTRCGGGRCRPIPCSMRRRSVAGALTSRRSWAPSDTPSLRMRRNMANCRGLLRAADRPWETFLLP
jgi:hypothetical protein